MSRVFGRHSTAMYRSRNGMLFGVCKGVADYFDLSVFWLRVIVLVCFVATGFFPTALAYLVAALLMKPDPLYY